jgi:hypothetical protein
VQLNEDLVGDDASRAAYISPRVKQVVAERGIRLMGYGEFSKSEYCKPQY